MEAGGQLSDAVSLAIFHTSFKVVGVAVLLPFLTPFTKLVYRIVPGEDTQFAAGLDPKAAVIPAVGVEAARHALAEMYAALVGQLRRALDPLDPRPLPPDIIDAVAVGLARCRDFLDHVQTDREQLDDHARHLAILHALDHLERLTRRLQSVPPLMDTVRDDPALEQSLEGLRQALSLAAGVDNDSELAASIEDISKMLTEKRKRQRHTLLRQAATGSPPPHKLDRLLRSLQWCDHIVLHLWRAGHYLEGGLFDPDDEPPPEEM